MGIHGHGELPECGVEHHVGGFTAHPRQGFQCFAGFWHFAIVPFYQQAAGLDDILGLAVVQTDGLDVLR
jgi:hypothetical protein